MLFNVLLLVACIPTLRYSLSAPTDKGNIESKTTLSALFRKHNGQFPMMPTHMFGSHKKKSQIESYYEPYWANGDWVYYRGESTSRPQPFFLNSGNTTKHDECNQICPEFMQNYGPVCGMIYNDYWAKYYYQSFEDYCHLELENCISPSKRLRWFPVKKGNCTERMTTQPFAHGYIQTRASVYEFELEDTTIV